MGDQAHDFADRKIAEFQAEVRETYRQAQADAQEALSRFLERFEKEDERQREKVKAGEMSEADYKAWRKGKILRSRQLSSTLDQVSRAMTEANQVAVAALAGKLPEVYAENANYAAFKVCEASGLDLAFSLVDAPTVQHMLTAGEALFSVPALDVAKDVAWNRRLMASQLTQGVLLGESIPKMARRVQSVTGSNIATATRTARTAVTGAECAGRVSSYERARDMGIKLKQEWVATLDGRTRHSHRKLDGEKAEVGGTFPNGCRFPGDPTARYAEICNCRCTLVAAVEGFETDDAKKASKLPKGMTYEEWREGRRRPQPAHHDTDHRVVDGSDIVGTWKRRRDDFEFEIEDVLDAQGFDGSPRIVDADEFDELVKQANGGRGFIAQRSYTGTSKEVADEYRRMLYEGKWYVDCSTGGAQYGQGMYCAADYTGKLTDGIRAEMEHYTALGQERNNGVWSNAVTYVETMTLDPSARIVTHSRAMAEKNLDQVTLANALKKTRADQMISEGEISGPDADYVRWRLGLTDGRPKSSLTYSEEDLNEFVEYVSEDLTEYLSRSDELRDLREMNIGSWAAAKGYDAINAEGHGESGSYTVVLNRTKLIIKRPEVWR